MGYTREQQKTKYLTDIRYHSDPDNFDQTLKNRYSLRNYHGLYFEMKRTTEFIKVINDTRITLKNKKILDVGCHHGWYSNLFAYLKNSADEIYGIDFIPEFIKTAKTINSSINYIEGDVYNLNFNNEYFDLILCNYVFNCFPHEDIEKIAHIISSKVKSNGYILYFDFYRPAISTFIKKILKQAHYGLPRLNIRIIKKIFPDFRIVKSKRMINIRIIKCLLKIRSYPPYWLLDIMTLILRKNYFMVLLQKE